MCYFELRCVRSVWVEYEARLGEVRFGLIG
jgi:hypothetical protein